MNWKREAEQTLKDYEYKKCALRSVREEHETLCMNLESLKSMSVDTPTQGGGNKQEEKFIGIIAKKAELSELYKILKREVGLTDRALNHPKITDNERKVLYRFFINRPNGHVEFLCEELCLEAAQVYRIKDEALRKFTLARYGKLQS